jgi:hypothetical protein
MKNMTIDEEKTFLRHFRFQFRLPFEQCAMLCPFVYAFLEVKNALLFHIRVSGSLEGQ